MDSSPISLFDAHKRTQDHDADWLCALRAEADRRWEIVRGSGLDDRAYLSDQATLVHADALAWIDCLPDRSLDAIVTDPPYGLIEYGDEHHKKLRAGRGGVWRIPPAWDGANRRPVPRFTVLSEHDRRNLTSFFTAFAAGLMRTLVPGGHLFLASNPLLSTTTFHAIQGSGFEKRGEIIRLVQTLRGGDRPKGSGGEFPDVTVMPRSGWEPWGVFRKPFEGTVAANLRRWGAGGSAEFQNMSRFAT